MIKPIKKIILHLRTLYRTKKKESARTYYIVKNGKKIREHAALRRKEKTQNLCVRVCIYIKNGRHL